MEKKILETETLYNDFRDLKELYSLASKDTDNRMIKEIFELSEKIKENSKKIQAENLLSKDADINNCYLKYYLVYRKP